MIYLTSVRKLRSIPAEAAKDLLEEGDVMSSVLADLTLNGVQSNMGNDGRNVVCQGWRPMKESHEMDPQLKLHVVEGKFDGKSEGRCHEGDEAVWIHLSNDLVRRVLLRLPLASQYRFRAVCKIWHDMLSSTRFVRDSAALRSDDSPPICAYEYSCPNRVETRSAGMFGRSGVELTDPTRADQLAPGPGTASNNICSQNMCLLDLSFAPSWILANKIIATRDGLLCTASSNTPRIKGPTSAHGGLCIINPFTRTWRELPPLPSLAEGKAWPWADEVMVDRTSPSHFVALVILGTLRDEEWFICRYSSKSNDWKVIPGDSTSERPVECRNYLFADRLLYSWKGDGSLFIHDLEEGKLLTISTPGYPVFPSRGINVSRIKVEIVEHQGSVYAGWMITVREPSMPMLGMSKLKPNMCWEESVRLPETLLRSAIVDLDMEDISDGLVLENSKVLDCKVIVLADFICVKLIHRKAKQEVTSETVIGYHVPSQTWKGFGIHLPHVHWTTNVELFVPGCLQVYL